MNAIDIWFRKPGSPLKAVAFAGVLVVTGWMIAGQGGFGHTVLSDVAGEFAVSQGDILLQERKYEAAIARFDDALKAAPAHRGALGGKAVGLIALERYGDAEAVLSELIDFLSRTLDDQDREGAGALAAALANRGILMDRQARYGDALRDYNAAIRIDREIAEGPGWIERLLYYDRAPSTVAGRAMYLAAQLELPEAQRLMRVPELDAEQRIYKP